MVVAASSIRFRGARSTVATLLRSLACTDIAAGSIRFRSARSTAAYSIHIDTIQARVVVVPRQLTLRFKIQSQGKKKDDGAGDAGQRERDPAPMPEDVLDTTPPAQQPTNPLSKKSKKRPASSAIPAERGHKSAQMQQRTKQAKSAVREKVLEFKPQKEFKLHHCQDCNRDMGLGWSRTIITKAIATEQCRTCWLRRNERYAGSRKLCVRQGRRVDLHVQDTVVCNCSCCSVAAKLAR